MALLPVTKLLMCQGKYILSDSEFALKTNYGLVGILWRRVLLHSVNQNAHIREWEHEMI